MTEMQLMEMYSDWCNDNNNYDIPFKVWVNTIWEDMV